MDEIFDLIVNYKGQEQTLKAQIHMLGYTHKIQVWLPDDTLFFEPDEERNYRAILDPSSLEDGKKIDIELLKTIAETIEGIVK